MAQLSACSKHDNGYVKGAIVCGVRTVTMATGNESETTAESAARESFLFFDSISLA